MTYKQIVYSVHATKRIKQRKFTREGIRSLLITGSWADEGHGVFSRTGFIGSREAKMFYKEGPRRIFVITIEWVE